MYSGCKTKSRKSKNLKLSLRNEDIKFCRRLGEKKAEPRSLIIGFYTEADRATLLRNARNLENTASKHVNICPDLTARQRKEEADMKAEADDRNENLTEDDLSKTWDGPWWEPEERDASSKPRPGNRQEGNSGAEE
jgi:hypothetical protein